MRLEYNENQEKELRITEIEAILENDLYENEVEEHCLEIELQFLQGNKNTYGEPYAFIGTDNVSFDVIYKYENDRYSATLYDKNGNPQRSYLNSENLEKLIGQILEIETEWNEFLNVKGENIMKRDLVDELYKIAYKRYREKYPNKDFASIPNFLDSLWFSIEGELNKNGYNAAKKYVEEAELIELK